MFSSLFGSSSQFGAMFQALALELDMDDVGESQPQPSLDERIRRSFQNVAPHMLLPDRLSGPKTAAQSVCWAPDAWTSLELQGVKFFETDLAAIAHEQLCKGLLFSSDYSGIGCPEEALDQILTAACEKGAVPDGSLFANLRAGDVSQCCREVLHAHSGPFSPQCIHDDILHRIRPSLHGRFMKMREACWEKVNRKVEEGWPKAEMIKTEGKAFVTRAYELLKVHGPQSLDGLAAYCHAHQCQCPLWQKRRESFNGWQIHVAGVCCQDWSTMGGKHKWLGKGVFPFLQWCRERELGDEDVIIVECVPSFDDETLQELLQEKFHMHVLRFSTTLFGEPVERHRAYMILISKRLRWSQKIQQVGLQKAFERIFANTSELLGSWKFRAPPDLLNEHFGQQCHRRKMPPNTRSGLKWSAYQLASMATRENIQKHLVAVVRSTGTPKDMHEWITNLAQNPDYMAPVRFRVPALLRSSKLWLFGHRRAPLPLELLELQGFNIFGGENYGPTKYQCKFVPKFQDMASSVIQSMAGNGIHLRAIGSVLLFCLSCVEAAREPETRA